MGAWTYLAPRLRDLLQQAVLYVGRPHRASPAEGYSGSHGAEQHRIVAKALALPGQGGSDRESSSSDAVGRRA